MKALPFSAITIFAEDAREEKSGQTTLVGILPDNLSVPGFPGALPKLAMHTRISVPIDEDIPDLSVWLEGPEGKHELVTFDQEMISKAKSEAAANGAPQYGLIGQAVASPFGLPAPTRVTVFVRSAGEEQISGSLNIIHA